MTLIELLLVLLLLTSLSVLTVPALLQSLQKNQLIRVEKELITAIQSARNISLSENKTLILAPLNATTDWSKGILLSENKKTILSWDWSQTKVQVSWHGFYSKNAMLISPDIKSASLSGHFILSLGNLPRRKLIVNRLGRIRLEGMNSWE